MRSRAWSCVMVCDDIRAAVTFRVMANQPAARRLTFLGLFLVALSTLMYEILLTRIFSVTMWYHFAFVAVSIAMFGMTVGAAIVFVLAGWFPQSGTSRQLAVSSLLFGALIVVSFIAHLSIPFDPGGSGRMILVLIGT